MRRDEISRQVRGVIAAELRCSTAKVGEEAEFAADLGASSLDKIGIASAIEERFGILLSDREVAFCETVGTAVDLVETKLENRRASSPPRFLGAGERRRA